MKIERCSRADKLQSLNRCIIFCVMKIQVLEQSQARVRQHTADLRSIKMEEDDIP